MGNLKKMEQALGFDILSIFCYNNSKKIESWKQKTVLRRVSINKHKAEQGQAKIHPVKSSRIIGTAAKRHLTGQEKQTNKGKNGLEQGRFFRNLARPHPAAEIYFTCGPFGWRRIDCSGRFFTFAKRF